MGYFDNKIASLGFLLGPRALGKGECHTHALGKMESDLVCLFYSLAQK